MTGGVEHVTDVTEHFIHLDLHSTTSTVIYSVGFARWRQGFDPR